MPVDRCICEGRTFSEIKQIAEKESYSTIEELQNNRICSTSCRLCMPYVEVMLKTGETSFEPGSVYRRKS